MMVRYWAIRLGEGGKYVDFSRKNNFVVLGFTKLGDLTWLKEGSSEAVFEKFSPIYKEVYKDENPTSLGVNMVLNFVKELKKGDIVLVPDTIQRKILFGEIAGDYEYKENWNDGCDYPNRKKVRWIKEISRDELSQKFKYSMGSLLTIFSLDKYQDEINNLISGMKIKSEKKEKQIICGDKLEKVVLDRISNLSGEEFEEFITDLLSSIGFNATTTKLVGDNGVDIEGSLNVKGILEANLKVQVKRRIGNISNDRVLSARGTLNPDEHGAIITTSSFTKPAIEEAEAQNKKPIKLIDGKQLVDLILEFYDDLDEKYKNLLKLKRKDRNIKEEFFAED